MSLGLGALAQGVPGAANGYRPERPAGPTLGESRAFTFSGSVLEPSGVPAVRAVVVSSAGGQAVTDEDGLFRLELRVPISAESVQLTAVGGATRNLLASQRVPLVAGIGSAWNGSLQLSSSAECSPDWIPTFGDQLNVLDDILVLAVFDDGAGPALYAGGLFSFEDNAGESALAKWDGARWMILGDGLSADHGFGVRALRVFDDGGGEALYAGGGFQIGSGPAWYSVARWDGTSWSALDAGAVVPAVDSLTVFDDGGGPALYAGGGLYSPSGGQNTNSIAKWSGSSWSALAGGVDGHIFAMAVHDDGSGTALFVGGTFLTAGGAPANHIARWDGSGWSTLGGGTNDDVTALAIFDDGAGPELHAGGSFTQAGSVISHGVAKWDGSTWGSLVPASAGVVKVEALSVFDDGSGAALFAGGNFVQLGNGVGARYVAKWNGVRWTSMERGMNYIVTTFCVFDDGTGAKLQVGGYFTGAGDQSAMHLAQWDGAQWKRLGNGFVGGPGDLIVFDDGSGAALYAVGGFTSTGLQPASNIAKWDGRRWYPLGAGLDQPGGALAVFDDGSGEALYVGGRFRNAGNTVASQIAKWDGAQWHALGAGLTGGGGWPSSGVWDMEVFDGGSGAQLYVVGSFTHAGGVAVDGIVKWDGSSWSALGSGPGTGGVATLLSFDDGSGPGLYAGGSFSSIGGVAANSIAKWDGQAWSALGSGIGTGSVGFMGTVLAMTTFDDGAGRGLYATGQFYTAGGLPASNIARWDGASWSALGSGLQGAYSGTLPYVFSLTEYDDGGGAELYAGGYIGTAGGLAVRSVAKWDGAIWSSLGAGLSSEVSAFAAFDDGAGEALYTAGSFAGVHDTADSFLAKWGTEIPCGNGTAYCFGDGSGAACPCGATGSVGAGCMNTSGTGMTLTASGIADTANDSFLLSVSGGPPSVPGLFFQGTNAPSHPVGDGVLCTSATLRHSPVVLDANGSARQFGFGSNANSGQTLNYQFWYRDPGNNCGGGFNLSNGWDVTWK